MPSPDHYATLDIPPSADLDAVKRAYRRKMRQHHPDQYIAQREALRQKGDTRALRDLERTISEAQAMTQRINGAYRVLADAESRERYDRERLQKTQNIANAHRPAPTRTSRTTTPRHTRPGFHRRANASPTPIEPIPWVIVGVFIVVLMLGFSAISTFLGAMQQSAYPTAIGYTAGELQATTNARQATYVARTQIALAPTATPLSQRDLLIGANTFYRQGSYNLAIENYNEAITREPDNAELYYLRGLAHLGLVESPQDSAMQTALDDFDRAITLDLSLLDAYRERGLVYYARWQVTQADVDRQQARADLNRYASTTPPDADVRQALNALDEGD